MPLLQLKKVGPFKTSGIFFHFSHFIFIQMREKNNWKKNHLLNFQNPSLLEPYCWNNCLFSFVLSLWEPSNATCLPHNDRCRQWDLTKAQCSPWLFEVSQLAVVLCHPAPRKLPRCDHNPLLPLDCETVVTGGRVHVDRVVSPVRTGAWGFLKRKSPRWVGVSEFLAGSVSSHYFSFPDSSLWGPTGLAVMDRYSLWGITGTKKEENSPKRGVHPQSSFHCTGTAAELKGKSCLAHKSQSLCTNLNVHFTVSSG